MRLFDLMPPNQAIFEQHTVLEISEVARMLIQDSAQERFPFRESFPRMVSPWDWTFFEYNLPQLMSIGSEQQRIPFGGQIGLQMQTIGCTGERIAELERHVRLRKPQTQVSPGVPRPRAGSEKPGDVRAVPPHHHQADDGLGEPAADVRAALGR